MALACITSCTVRRTPSPHAVAGAAGAASLAPVLPAIDPARAREKTQTPITSEPAEVPTPHGVAPLAGEPFVALPFAKDKSVVVSLPLGATEPRPVIVATHGAGGRAELQCELWRRLIGDAAFVVCPRGVSMMTLPIPQEERTYFYAGHPSLASEIDAVLAVVRERYASHVDLSEPIYAGFSQGAGMGAMALPTHGARFARAVLIEGGFGEYREWDIATAKRYSENGGRRVLFVCGRLKCAELARKMARWLVLGGVEAKVAYVEGGGHSYRGPVEERIASELPWITAGDARWQRAVVPSAPRSRTMPR
jgi:predicted esterase